MRTYEAPVVHWTGNKMEACYHTPRKKVHYRCHPSYTPRKMVLYRHHIALGRWDGPHFVGADVKYT